MNPVDRRDFLVQLGLATELVRRGRRPVVPTIVLTNGHAPEQFRAQTVRNIDAWYPAFNVQPGQKLYLAPNQRVKIWG